MISAVENPSALSTWLAYVEAAARADALERELALVHDSRSWKVTAPLRAAMRSLGGSKGALSQPTRPMLRQPEQSPPKTSVDLQLPAPLDRVLLQIGASNDTPRLYVDVTALELEDLGAGIQRVTRRVLGAMYADPEIPFAPIPVCLRSDGSYYRAYRFLERFLGLPVGFLEGEKRLSARSGDVLLGLDLCREFADVLEPAWASLRQVGVPIIPVVYDTLPIVRPDWFPDPVPRELQRWLDVVSAQADLAICISSATRDSLVQTLRSSGRQIPPVSVVPMGADGVRTTIPHQALLERSSHRVLMVGTIEPRKGYGEVLEVFDRLWADGCDMQLVIVGHPGWKVDDLLQRIRKRAHASDRLVWFGHADDRTLQGLYLSNPLLLAASEGEGFGLPILEAAAAGCRLLLRDLPVFREVAGDGARYFEGAEGLEAALRQFNHEPVNWPTPPSARGLPSWRDTAQAICACAARMASRSVEI